MIDRGDGFEKMMRGEVKPWVRKKLTVPCVKAAALKLHSCPQWLAHVAMAIALDSLASRLLLPLPALDRRLAYGPLF